MSNKKRKKRERKWLRDEQLRQPHRSSTYWQNQNRRFENWPPHGVTAADWDKQQQQNARDRDEAVCAAAEEVARRFQPGALGESEFTVALDHAADVRHWHDAYMANLVDMRVEYGEVGAALKNVDWKERAKPTWWQDPHLWAKGGNRKRQSHKAFLVFGSIMPIAEEAAIINVGNEASLIYWSIRGR